MAKVQGGSGGGASWREKVRTVPRRWKALLVACMALLVLVAQGQPAAAAMSASLRRAILPSSALAGTAGVMSVFLNVAFNKFQNNVLLYSTIPIIAGLLNWATNYLAVKMIFYPINFVGIKFRTWPEQPFGVIGWTGIVPVKAASMAQRMVRMVTSKLIDVEAVGRRVDATRITELLAPALPRATQRIADQLGVGLALRDPFLRRAVQTEAQDFVVGFTNRMHDNINEIMDLEGMVVRAMVKDKKLLVELFQECGEKELKYVIRSGLYFGFLLGIFQMMVWVVWDPWWSLAVGGMVVGYLTNFFAIKSIFEPVQPVQVGPWKIQGLFLTRQYEVSEKFAKFLRSKVLTAEQMWEEILNGSRRGAFDKLLTDYINEYARQGTAGIVTSVIPRKALQRLPIVALPELRKFLVEEQAAMCPYMNEVLLLEDEMREKMRMMSSEEFEGVLHPIFAEDELTLILIGAALGFTVGLLQSQAPY